MKYNKAKDDVKKQTDLLANYQSAYNYSQGLNSVISDEDKLYKAALHDREVKLMDYQKEQIKEKTKFSDALQGNVTKTSIIAKDKVPINNTDSYNIFNDLEDDEDNDISAKLAKESQIEKEAVIS